MREETGYTAHSLAGIGWVHPNPAIQSNRCFTFLARGVVPAGDPEPDEDEEFEELDEDDDLDDDLGYRSDEDDFDDDEDDDDFAIDPDDFYTG